MDKTYQKRILKQALQGRKVKSKSPSADYSPEGASRGIYQSGPWSDALKTTHVKQQVVEFNKRNK